MERAGQRVGRSGGDTWSHRAGAYASRFEAGLDITNGGSNRVARVGRIVYRGYFWLLNNAHKLGDLSLIGLLRFKEGPRGGRILASLIVSAGIVGIGATP